MDNRYLNIMEEYELSFRDAAMKTLEEIDSANTVDEVAACVAAPSLYSFVWWVLRKVQEEKLEDLYFLARDGYILYKIADIICKQFKLPIRLHYLYCSRMALRKATYSLPDVNFEDYIFEGGYKITPEIIFARAGLTDDKITELMKTLDKEKIYLQQSLSKTEQKWLRQKLMKMPAFVECCMNGSREQLRCCQGYLQQEGILNKEQVGIVDTGWTGSVQKCLSQIVREANPNCQLVGFYFGLYNNSVEYKSGKYYGWYFDGNSPLAKAAKFNNNLLESFCACKDSMTIGYRQNGERYEPVFAIRNSLADHWDIPRQQSSILSFAENIVQKTDFDCFPKEKYQRMSQRLLEQFMYYPTSEEAQAYSGFLFCDDMSEKYLVPLAVTKSKKEIHSYWVPKRCIRTFLLKKETACLPVYWPAGTICLSEIKNAERWKKQFLLWDMLHIWKRRRK